MTRGTEASSSPEENDPERDPQSRLQSQIETLVRQNTELALALARTRREADSLRAALPSDDPGAAEMAAPLRVQLTEKDREIARLIKLGGTGADHEALRQYAADLEHRHLSVLGSTSWTLTAPFRALIRVVLRQPRPARFETRYLNE